MPPPTLRAPGADPLVGSGIYADKDRQEAIMTSFSTPLDDRYVREAPVILAS